MLSYELMGLLALWILWINTALIAGAALLDLRRLRQPYRGFRRLPPGAEGLGVVRGQVTAASPGSPAFARLAIVRTGRLADERSLSIQFGAQRPVSTLFGGRVRVSETELEVEPGPARVWQAPSAIHARLAAFTEAELSEAEAESRRRKGYLKTTELDVAVGQEVYVAGRFDSKHGWRVQGDLESPLLVSTVDPARFVARQTWLTLAFVFAMIVVLLGISLLAMQAPLFGPLSKVGGVLGLAYFLLVLPAATALRERTRAPDLRSYFGHWRAPRRPVGEAGLEGA